MTHRTALSLVFLSLAVPSSAAADEARSPAPIVRFAQVDDHLFRGGQPDAAGFEHLKRLGVRTIVNLRRDERERDLAEAMGFRYVSLSTGLTPFGLGGSLSADVVRRFFEVVDDPASGPVFVHCRRGADRTGTLIAMHRVARQGWTAEAAYAEARSIGMRWWHFPTKGHLRAFAATVTRVNGA
jgi:protein tyrosine/serine phosphatase